jgi:hypothetical protein
MVSDLNVWTQFTLPFIPSSQGRGKKKIPFSPWGRGTGEGYMELFLTFTLEKRSQNPE